ncbi:hypothetical protein SI855_002721 [Clostridioides difficile]|nr:hypothetical protein [Clostridioides difficile]
MNIYDDFYRGMNPNEWEFFAVDFFKMAGYTILDLPAIGPDGGKDLKVEYEGKKYIVSCKHFIISGNTVGTGVEENILDRVVQHEVDGFIGFYSTQISNSLKERFDKLNSNCNYTFTYLDKYLISQYIPYMNFQTLQKFGMCNGLTYVSNVPESDYKPLNCLFCGKKDILDPLNIDMSIVTVYNYDNEYHYAYGCKGCIPVSIYPWADISQVLHLEHLQKWNNEVDFIKNEYKVSEDFYRYESIFNNRILQRIYPQNLGTWL